MQVFNGAQHAMAHVHAYPCLVSIDHLLDCLAAQQHQPTRQQLLATAHTVDTTAHWETLFMYVNDLREPDYPVYKPFIKAAQIQVGALEPCDVSATSTAMLLPVVE